MKNIKLTATIATLTITAIAQPCQALTVGEFGKKVAKTTATMMTNHRHVAAAKNWNSSDYYLLTEDRKFLQDAIDAADRRCDRYAVKKLWWSPIAYNQFTNELIAGQIKGIPTFAPTEAQQEKLHATFLAAAVAYEAEKLQCPSIVWRR